MVPGLSDAAGVAFANTDFGLGFHADSAFKRGMALSMTPGIEAAQQARADLVVVITDGDVDWPEQVPKIPVIAALLGRYTNPDDVPSWIHTVVINDISKGHTA